RGTRIVDTRLVVVRSASREEIASARGADACAATTGRSAALLPPGGRTGRHRAAATRSKTTPAATRPQQKSTVHPHGVLGAHFTRIVEAVKSIPPILFAVVGLAILLLGIASLPLSVAPGGRAAAALAHRRGVIAFAGATALAA